MTPSSGYLTDVESVERDLLDFDDFEPALLDVLSGETPLTLGVYGAWGSGKSTLLKRLERQLRSRSGDPEPVLTVWFTAWKYDRHEALWRAFILRVLEALFDWHKREFEDKAAELTAENKERGAKLLERLRRMEESVYRAVEWTELGRLTADWDRLLPEAGKAAGRLAAAFVPFGEEIRKAIVSLAGGDKSDPDLPKAAAAIRREVSQHFRERLESMEQFESSFREALGLAFGEVDRKPAGRLVVFVDDLDRCLPEKAVEVLEAIKLFLAVPGANFVLGMDPEVIERGIEERYKALRPARETEGRAGATAPLTGTEYLEKLVQIPFHLPALSEDRLGRYIESLVGEGGEEGQEGDRALAPLTRRVFAAGLHPRPRQVKRALNIFRLLEAIARRREERGHLPRVEGDEPCIAWPLLAKTVVIQSQYPAFYALWRQWPTLILSLEEHFVAARTGERAGVLRAQRREMPVPEEVAEAAEAAKKGAAPPAEAAEPATSQAPAGGSDLLAEWKRPGAYPLLERMLRLTRPEEAEQGRSRARFKGLERKQIEYYVTLAGAVEAPPKDAVVGPAAAGSDLLSGNWDLVRDAVGRLESEEARVAQARALAPMVTEFHRPAAERVAAGLALGLLGDSRPGVAVREGLPKIDWVQVEAGRFLMGSKEGEAPYQDETPQFTFEIDEPFRLGRYPVTVAQFAAFLQDGGYAGEDLWTKAGWAWREQHDISGPEDYTAVFQTPNHPRVGVSWYEAMAFCAWLSRRLGCSVALPTEAQWERAARHTDGREYPWGPRFEADRCNSAEAQVGSTSAAGAFPRGAADCGADDMAGNVWEWTASLWGEDLEKPSFGYPYDPADGRENLDAPGEVRRVVRGGSFDLNREFARCAVRLWDHAGSRSLDVGFRVLSPGL